MNLLRRYAPLFNIIQRILDISILLAVTWLVKRWYGQPDLMRVLAIYGTLLLVVIFSLFNVYRSWRSISLTNQMKTLLLAWITVLLVFNVLILLLSNKAQLAILWPFCLFKTSEFLVWSVLVFLGILSVRVATKWLLVFFRKRGYNQRRAVIVGAGDAGKELAKYLDENPQMGIKVRGFFDDRLVKGEQVMGSPNVLGEVLGSIDECPGLSLAGGYDVVFVALPMRAAEKINKLIWALGTKGVNVLLVPDLFAFGIQRARMHQMGELPLMSLNLFPAWKRSFDLLFSVTVMILTFPVWLIIIILIKTEDGGSIFYKDPRIGESGKSFRAWKFRTMHVNAAQRLRDLLDKNPAFREEYERTYKLKNDPRITKIGKILRKTSLDELPQFLNVIIGDMSVVGARPVLPPQFETHYNDIALTYCATRPGITGPWQIGSRSNTTDYKERVELDKWYVLNASIWLDIKIIFKTIWRVFRPKGAY